MKVDLGVENISHMGAWLLKNEDMLLQYAINFIWAIAIISLGVFISSMVGKALKRVMQVRKIDATVNHFLSAIVRYAILIVAFIAALGQLGIQTTSVIAVLGAAGLAIALSLQSSLSNFAAGVLLVTFRPFKVGELIQSGSYSGTVENVQIFSTTIRMSDNKMVTIPNNKLISNEVVNYTRHPRRRIDITVGVGYNADIDQVKTVLLAVIKADPRVLKDADMMVRLNEMAASSLNFIVRCWTLNADYWPVYYDLMENMKKTLDEHGIEIPFPQMDIHFRNRLSTHTEHSKTVSS